MMKRSRCGMWHKSWHTGPAQTTLSTQANTYNSARNDRKYGTCRSKNYSDRENVY